MATCPFKQGNTGNFDKAPVCSIDCALNVNGECAITVIARSHLQKNSNPAHQDHFGEPLPQNR